MPERIKSLVSSSRWTSIVGSSSIIRWRPCGTFSSSAFVLGSNAKGIDDGFKNVGRKWRARILCSLLSFTRGRTFAFHLSFVQRRWEIVYHRFQELRDADLACGRAV